MLWFCCRRSHYRSIWRVKTAPLKSTCVQRTGWKMPVRLKVSLLLKRSFLPLSVLHIRPLQRLPAAASRRSLLNVSWAHCSILVHFIRIPGLWENVAGIEHVSILIVNKKHLLLFSSLQLTFLQQPQRPVPPFLMWKFSWACPPAFSRSQRTSSRRRPSPQTPTPPLLASLHLWTMTTTSGVWTMARGCRTSSTRMTSGICCRTEGQRGGKQGRGVFNLMPSGGRKCTL